MSRKASLDQFIAKKKNLTTKRELETDEDELEGGEETEIFEGEELEMNQKFQVEKSLQVKLATETEDTDKAMLLSVDYDGKYKLAYCRLYDLKTKKIITWYDNTNHKPYLLSDLSIEELNRNYPKIRGHKGFLEFRDVKKFDLITDQLKDMIKIITDDPLSVGGSKNSIREIIKDNNFEAFITYHTTYLYDNQLIPGMNYIIKNKKLRLIKPSIPANLEKELKDAFSNEKEEFKAVLPKYIDLFFASIPDIKRIAFDIEVKTTTNKIPNTDTAVEPVTCVSFVDSDNIKRVFLYLEKPISNESKAKIEKLGAKVVYYTNEKQMIEAIFELLSDYPVVITFNGDNFDLPYLHNRAKNLGISNDRIPFVVHKESYSFINSVHLDLYNFYFNRAIQVSAFANTYKNVSLDEISLALLKEGKLEHEEQIFELDYERLAEYCLKDSELTYRLTSFDDNLVMKLLILLMRITKLPIEDISRSGISNWIKNLFYYEHRGRNYLIPNPNYINQIKSKSATTAIIKGKKYMGAKVIDPIAGVHFNVVVLDFASLYPSVIKEWNLSYETVNCPHTECTDNLIPNTPHWACKKRVGISAILIGLLRDLRVKYFKNKAKDKSLSPELRNLFKLVQASMKVIINASYGVFGSEMFPLYCLPVAESTSAIGRYAIDKTIEKVQSLGLEVIYGDTDSVFIKNPTKQHLNEIIDWSNQELGIELDVEKYFRYVALSDRKKNYLGVYQDGNVDIKGLSGKKRNTPLFLQNAFKEMITSLSKVYKPEDFEVAKDEITSTVKTCFKKLKKFEYSPEELAFKVTITKAINKYSVLPQHVKAAKILHDRTGKEIGKGDIIYFLKTKDPSGVQPIEIANVKDIDVDKYKETIESIFEQVLDALNINFDDIKGKTTLDKFM